MSAGGRPADVRMRGFRSRASVDEVQAWIDALLVELAAETAPLAAAAGRVLAEDIVSPVDVPSFARAAMDGWAVRAEATFGASETDPVTLRVVGVALPGVRGDRALRPGEALRIMTGAPLPHGADAVLRAEEGTEDDGVLTVRHATVPGRDVGRVGEDVRAGTRVLAAGRRLRPQDLGVAASVGRGDLPLLARPRVSLLVTGDELLPPGRMPEGASIVDANTPMLDALVVRDGGEVIEALRVGDAREDVSRALDDARGDVLLVSGGSSVGQEDHAPVLVAERGRLVWHGVAMTPPSPSGAVNIAGRPVFLLPGNPVSCLSAYDFFAGRLVRRLAGRTPAWPYPRVRLSLSRKIASVLGRVDYVRVRVRETGVEPLMSRGASILTSTTEADGFVVVPEASEGWPPGAKVDVWLYDAAAASEPASPGA